MRGNKYIYICIFALQNMISVAIFERTQMESCMTRSQVHLLKSHCITLQRTATHCDALRRTETHCNALQRTATLCNTLPRTRTRCNTLQHTATRCNTLQHTATRCNTLQHAHPEQLVSLQHTLSVLSYCNTLQPTASPTATHGNRLQHTLSILYYCNPHCNPL